MALSTYTEFLSDIAGWLDRTNLTPRIPDFIALAQVRMNREIRVYWNVKTYTYTVLLADDIDFSLPTRFNGIRSIRITNNPTQQLRYITPENLGAHNYINATGKASFFTIVSNQIRIVPAPVTDDVIEIIYYEKAQPLVSNTVETNLFTINAPDALLYASLLEAKPYVKDGKNIALWVELYENAITKIRDDDSKFRWGEQSLEPMAAYAATAIARTSTG